MRPPSAYRSSVDDSLEAWFTREILPYEGALTRYLSRRRNRTHDIEDLRNDIYIRVLESAQTARPSVPKAFLFITARNLLVDRTRHDRIVAIDQLEDLELPNVLVDDVSAERHASGRQQLARLAKLFDRLPRRCREVLWMRKVEGLPQKDVAARLGLADATVEKHLYRALKTLTDALNGNRHATEGTSHEHAVEAEPRHGE
jgi:RNA polymerase sigma factor (sigma-70 family)